jgi:hypothetical protein
MNFVFDRRVLLLRQEHNIFLLPNYHCRCPCYRQFYCLSLFALKNSITDFIGRISYATLTMFGLGRSIIDGQSRDSWQHWAHKIQDEDKQNTKT